MENWISVPLPGAWVKSSHPRTCLNPDEFFQVLEIKYEHDKFWIRGENTCWFNLNMITPRN